VGESYDARRARQAASAADPFEYFTTDFDAGLRSEREQIARQDQEDWDAMHANRLAIDESLRQANEALSTPHSTVHVSDDYDTGGVSNAWGHHHQEPHGHHHQQQRRERRQDHPI
jgi:hypothetical protein